MDLIILNICGDINFSRVKLLGLTNYTNYLFIKTIKTIKTNE